MFDALAAGRKPPKTVAVVTSKFPSIFFLSQGAREVMKKRGLTEVLYLEWDFGNRDFGPIANRIKDAKPDFVWVGAIGLDGNLLLDAMKKIDYEPPQHFYIYPAPGPLVTLPEAKNALSADDFRGAAAVHDEPRRRRVHQALSRACDQGELSRSFGRGAGGRFLHGLADSRGRRSRGPRASTTRRSAPG